MRNISIYVGCTIGALLGIAGCMKEVGLGSPGGETSGSGGAGVAFGGGGGAGPGKSFGGGGSGPGTSFGSGGSSGTGSSGTSMGSGGSSPGTGSSGTSMGSGGSPGTGAGADAGPSCDLGSQQISCDFAHLNADCAPYGAVCDYVFSKCSCCFLHETVSCATDADCQATIGASSYCSSGTCACK